MKATCIKRVVNFNPFFIIEKDETVDVSIENDKFFRQYHPYLQNWIFRSLQG